MPTTLDCIKCRFCKSLWPSSEPSPCLFDALRYHWLYRSDLTGKALTGSFLPIRRRVQVLAGLFRQGLKHYCCCVTYSGSGTFNVFIWINLILNRWVCKSLFFCILFQVPYAFILLIPVWLLLTHTFIFWVWVDVWMAEHRYLMVRHR